MGTHLLPIGIKNNGQIKLGTFAEASAFEKLIMQC